ncbi:MAG TPA: hypothetical protein PK367_01970 [Candidatus Paceibacterota bacterium]|nr:hypothetical protein [Candidatus Magasanikbacteria bacterium]HPW34508.1 hypothetical protein [Candidatus Paceibacterota bacterium]
MFDGLKNKLKQLRYENSDRKQRIFWIFTIGIFAVIVIIWILFFSNLAVFSNFHKFSEEAKKELNNIWEEAQKEIQSAKNSSNQSVEEKNPEDNIATSTQEVTTQQ